MSDEVQKRNREVRLAGSIKTTVLDYEADLEYERSVARSFLLEKNIGYVGYKSVAGLDLSELLANFMDWLSEHNGDLSALKVP